MRITKPFQIALVLFILALSAPPASAHNLWIETSPVGEIGQYVIETIYTEDNPGTFQEDNYEAIRHTATFNIPPSE